jgi:hypothetical protein
MEAVANKMSIAEQDRYMVAEFRKPSVETIFF